MRALGIFVRAPLPGRVKRELTDEVGPSAAAEVHWQLGRRVVANVVTSGYRSVVWYTPRGEGAFVREWLEGLGRIELRPLGGGPLARRVEHAMGLHFVEGARRVIIVSADSADVDRRVVAAAFAALDDRDVVLGPTLDGFVYLVGLRASQPLLFRDLSWERRSVAPGTIARARALGLSLRLLPPLRSVRTARDARLAGLLKP